MGLGRSCSPSRLRREEGLAWICQPPYLTHSNPSSLLRSLPSTLGSVDSCLFVPSSSSSRSILFRIIVRRCGRHRHVVLCGLDRDVWHRNGCLLPLPTSNRLAFSVSLSPLLDSFRPVRFDSDSRLRRRRTTNAVIYSRRGLKC